MSADMSSHSQPYKRVQLFSGGGYRFGYYLGSYAALCEQGLKPDLILATCGGSLASLLVDIAPEPPQLKSLLESEALYKVVKASQHRQNFAPLNTFSNSDKYSKPNYFYQALKRLGLSKSPAQLNKIHNIETHDQLLAELASFAMLEISQEQIWLDELTAFKDHSKVDVKPTPDIAIIASRIMPVDSQPPPQSPARLQEVLFMPNKLNSYLSPSDLQCPTHRYAPKRIERDIHLIPDWDIKQAVRASMADMYYLQPAFIDGLGWSLGGVIDLTPIELAAKFGQCVFAETKAGYDKVLAAPAIMRIFGFDPNRRLDEVLNYKNQSANKQSIHWLPFADNGKALAGHHVSKRLNLKHRRIDLIHADYDDFISQMQAQWHYGYERTLEYLRANDLI